MYGNVSMVRGYCSVCKNTCIILNNEKQCCGRLANENQIFTLPIKRVIQPEKSRRRFSKNEKQSILMEQDFRCIYCDMYFGVLYEKKSGRLCKTTVHFDHFIPFTHSQNNKKDNIVAACNICNAFKGDKMFNSIEEAKIYILNRVKQRGILYV